MANIFYSASGNPATGAEGLSSLMRAEFLAIQAGFDLVPAITTTGLYSTVFNQLGSYTFTLPGQPGTLATTDEIAAEATRAMLVEQMVSAGLTAEISRAQMAEGSETMRATQAEGANTAAITNEVARATQAESANATAIATERTRAQLAEGTNAAAIVTETQARTIAEAGEVTARNTAIAAETSRATTAEAALQSAINAKQGTIGYTALQQGGGIGQAANKVYIGYGTGVGLKATVDSSDLGYIVTTNQPQGFLLASSAAAAYQPLSPNNPYVKNYLGANVVALGWNGTLNAQVDATALGQVPTQNAPGNFIRNGDAATHSSVTATVSMTTPVMTITSGVSGSVSGAAVLSSAGTNTGQSGPITYALLATTGCIIAPQFFATSDGRGKSDVTEITDEEACAYVQAARSVTYIKDGAASAGFIAQEDLRTVRSASIGHAPDDRPAFATSDGFAPDGMRLVKNYEHDIAYLTAALQFALRSIAELKGAA